MKLSTRARRALDELWAVRAEAERASTELARYGRVHAPARADDYERAAGVYDQVVEMFGASLDNFTGMTALLAAEEAERRADSEPVEGGPYGGPRVREMEHA